MVIHDTAFTYSRYYIANPAGFPYMPRRQGWSASTESPTMRVVA